ncbi:DUF155-domain-containing protein [Clavulina sp. PMI_390]|nr:DUF155-domain-containing protein [Clavulina sp. PMI_390]
MASRSPISRRGPLQSIPELSAPFPPKLARRGSISKGLKVPLGPKTKRTSKVSQKLVVLPSEPQTRPLTDEASAPQHHRSEGERMSKEERERDGYNRMTAYSVALGYKAKALAPFLKREHGVSPRIFDEAIYASYHLPLLSGYTPNVNVRSSVAPKPAGKTKLVSALSEAEEEDWEGGYFAPSRSRKESFATPDGYISASPPTQRTFGGFLSETEPEIESALESETSPRVVHKPLSDTEDAEIETATYRPPPSNGKGKLRSPEPQREEAKIAELVVFDYGVAVFTGFEESDERLILEDLHAAGLCESPYTEDNWEIEQCHYVYDPSVSSPRIYNDFFTFKQQSHLLTLSISHALAQSTLLAHYESTAQVVLNSPQTTAIPRQMATSGSLKLRRTEALRLTGRLFKLRRDVNLVSNVLDIPELFWSEASLKGLYDACREYFEIDQRAQVLNEKLSVASDLLDLIHDHLNTGAMDKITWIVIWLIVVAILVELGEVLARLVVHAATGSASSYTSSVAIAKLEQKCMALTQNPRASLAFQSLYNHFQSGPPTPSA